VCRRQWKLSELLFEKMAYALDERLFIVKAFYSAGSDIQVQHDFRREFICREGPSRSALNRLVQKFENTGAVTGNKKSVLSVETEQRGQ
jgi:hypothetical protein